MSSVEQATHTLTPRCTQCNPQQDKQGRNLVVCIDGTSNQSGQDNTNVEKLFTKIDLESNHPEQRAYYSSGIGTTPKSLQVFDRMERAVADKFDMPIAWNIEEIVKDTYGWLARTYKEGDQIYLFGFSRGAYQVRVLAGMIHEVGLITKPTEKQIGTAYDYYEAIRSKKPKTRKVAREFKNTFSQKDLRVHFVGVWDSVSSVRPIGGDVFLSSSSSAAYACHLRHALALDELRVQFKPEYFHELNSQTDDDVKSKYIVISPDAEHAASSTTECRQSTVTANGTDVFGGKKRTTEIKEVWFAGSHSDVGGRNRPGKSHQAGNASLLWMRREAANTGLVLLPTDIVWVPDDLDFGTSDPTSRPWRAIENMSNKHQESFSGIVDHARLWLGLKPRRIIPGQKVHASILFANAYKPQASLGEGFDIPVVYPELDDTELDGGFWETGLFDDTSAQELMMYLAAQQGIAPIHLDRLLFMLRFKEGRQCVRNVPHWQDRFTSLIRNRECAPLVRLITIVAYYEASCEPDVSIALSHASLEQDILDDAKQTLAAILSAHKHRDGPRVVSLLTTLTKHRDLRERILTQDVLELLMRLFDVMNNLWGEPFVRAMDGLRCLLQCEDTRKTIIEWLGANYPFSNFSRISRILEIDDSYFLPAVLRMVFTLAQIPEARAVCSTVKPMIKELARRDERLVGPLAAEILLALHDPNEREQLNIHDTRFRNNLASALARLNSARGDPAVAGQQILRQLFGLDVAALNATQRYLHEELKSAVKKGNTQERTAATMTLLNLCASSTIRTHLLEINLLDVFVNQLRRKDSALLAAYALATCLKYSDMKESMNYKEKLAKNIVRMLRLDYFDDAVGQVEGFQIFGDLMRHVDIQEKIKSYNVIETLKTKLGKGNPKETRTSLICLIIFQSSDQDGGWTSALVDKGLKSLSNQEWKIGVTILSTLAQTEHGVVAICPKIHKIVEMLLPEGYKPVQKDTMNTESADSGLSASDNIDTPTRSPVWMMGPACALRILAQNETLRNCIRNLTQYDRLKNLYFFGSLLDEGDTSPWRVWVPNRGDVIEMLDKMIKTVNEELSEDDLMLIGDPILPHIRHWDRLVTLFRDRSLAAITFLPALLGTSMLAVLAVISFTPIYVSYRTLEFLKRVLARYLDGRILDSLRGFGPDADGQETDSGIGGPSGDGAEDIAPSGHEGEGSQGDDSAGL